MIQVTVRIYGSLNDFLLPSQRQVELPVRFAGSRSVKDLIEALGVPHPEIDLVLLDGQPVPFESAAHDGSRVAAFPRFQTIDISQATRVRPPKLAAARFVLDGHLGKLARRLRLVGLDAICPVGARDDALAWIAQQEERILLTRDRELLKHRIVVHGYCVRDTRPEQQLIEVLQHYGPLPLQPFSRCLRCNGELLEVAKKEVDMLLPPRVRERHDRFRACRGCGQVYWQGTHWARLVQAVGSALQASGDHGA